ncbi:LysR family transcriptional regulator [Novosphingobium sp. Gsoil 351]|uniref:LysR family transcriptional regulator n=1 Tax=Novosphingobium sp. Gsoil 351 TaxID=2675225 RepID=UPI0012B465B3|nr:LysR family transcriptional regulator [Novosphingobium sp. Gsoil 351]QGN55960.1 LysR family transcriptional regulator [Novosphingobium sp. Gsoil 351]
MFDWNDLRHFLAVARSGSTLAASRTLRVSQATVSRRVSTLEETLGTPLFARSASGYELTSRGRAVLPLAEAVEAAVIGFDEAVKAETRRLSGKVMLTTVESAANSWIIPALAQLREVHPEISVEIVTSDLPLDLARGDADVAIRFGRKPTQESLVVRHLTDLEECFYASREMVTRLGRPCTHAELASYPMVGYSDERLGDIGEWIAANVPNARYVQRANALSSIVAAVRAGVGAAVLPTIMGDDIRNLVRLMPPIPPKSTCWLVTTDAARRQPHVRAVIDCVVAQVEATMRRGPADEARYA